MINKLPEKTVERLSQYRRTLLNALAKDKTHIYSHELASLLHITPVQVRRDIMLIGYSGTLKKGYDIKELINLIGSIIDTQAGLKVAVVGIGNLGRAMISYFRGKRTKLSIVAAFDNNPEKVDKLHAGVPCFHVCKMQEVIKKEGIKIGIITVPPQIAPQIAEELVNYGIKGILNYTPIPLNVSSDVFLEEYDMITSLEKVAFFVKKQIS